MDIEFACQSCGQRIAADPDLAGRDVDCPCCGCILTIPEGEQVSEISFTPPEDSAINPFDTASDKLTCPVCWLRFSAGDIMHITVHDSLRGDPVLGEDAQQRFQATRFNDVGQGLDAMGLVCSDLACPHCRRKLPPGFLDLPHHIISLVGDQSAGKSYFLSVLMKVLPTALYRHFGITFLDADPTENAALNEMKKALFGAETPAQAKLAKTQLEGAMYERLPRHGRVVALPKPFVYTLGSNDGKTSKCSIVFYDNAGEHFQPGINPVEQPGAQHVAAASGIMFLFDPFNSPEFRSRLKDFPDPQLEKPVVDQQDLILSEMRSRIQNIKNLRIDQQIETPLAILIGKCDAWMHLANGKPFVNPLESGRLSLSAIHANSVRVRDLLFSICPSIVANAEALSKNVLYFPVSPFGHSPIKIGPGDYVPDPAKLIPLLVEIPALWLLTQIDPVFKKAFTLEREMGDASAKPNS
jgi:hypothetical protein